MTVLIQKSICVDCKWRESCQRLARINEDGHKKGRNPGHPDDTFEVVIITCSIKNYDRTYGDKEKMYYCVDCKSMHHDYSRIGKLHKKGGL